jgi:hypothetical protein
MPDPATEIEGVTKFVADHSPGPLPRAAREVAARLGAWRTILAQAGLVGIDPARYGGVGFGNVSARLGPFPGSRGARAFLVSGTGTGGHRCVDPGDFAVVRRYDIRRNSVESVGPTTPSSESMTHGAVYDLGAHIRWVFHAHCPTVWSQAAALGLPTTAPGIDYGTVEMAREVARLARSTTLHDRGVFAMAGHTDGVVAFGRTAEWTGAAIFGTLAAAYERDFRAGPLCVT